MRPLSLTGALWVFAAVQVATTNPIQPTHDQFVRQPEALRSRPGFFIYCVAVAHPQQFDDDDPVLAKLRKICMALPGADVKISHGRPAFFTKKIFAGYGAVLKGEHHTGRYDQALVFMPDPDDAEVFAQDDRFFSPAYWGPSGWIGLDLGGETDWDEVVELIEDSYRATAPKKLIAELDADRNNPD